MRAERDMLDTLALVNLKIFLNLPLRTGVFVDGDAESCRRGSSWRENATLKSCPRCRRSGFGGN